MFEMRFGVFTEVIWLMTYIVILWVMIACSFVTGYQHATNDNTYNKIMTEEWSFTVNSAAKIYVSFYSYNKTNEIH
jgi:hypothetical protein